MKFWLKYGHEYIFLDQLFKALGWSEDYQDIRRHIERAEVKVNDSAALNRRTQLKEGDIVQWHGKHIIIAGARMVREEALQARDEGHQVHNRGAITWTEKPIKPTEKHK
ncbi:MAG: RNA-binding S4 domain-containing protein [Candidatus Cloacimonetes bacterium]|nr:RNA-binding S4 domain-containing protein [Candidatus Cloacimonadota bacterium]